MPDLESAPTAALARVLRRSVAADRNGALLDDGDARGEPRLHAALATWLARTRGLTADPAAVHTVRGAQNGLDLAGRALLAPGDRVAIEAYAHPSPSALIRLLQLDLAPVPVDGEDMDVAALEVLDEDRRVRAVYVTPHHQRPTTTTLSPPRRR